MFIKGKSINISQIEALDNTLQQLSAISNNQESIECHTLTTSPNQLTENRLVETQIKQVSSPQPNAKFMFNFMPS